MFEGRCEITALTCVSLTVLSFLHVLMLSALHIQQRAHVYVD